VTDHDIYCKHCHRRIRYAQAPLGGAWQHVWSMSIYCDQGGDIRAEP
jgi:hypothetical protein